MDATHPDFDLEPLPAGLQAGGPHRPAVGPDQGPPPPRGGGPGPRVHDGHRIPHGDLPPGPPGHPGGVRARRDRVPLLLVYEELWHGEAFSRFLGEAGYRLPPDGERTWSDAPYPRGWPQHLDPASDRCEGLRVPRGHPCRRGHGQGFRGPAHDVGRGERAVHPAGLPPGHRQDAAPGAGRSPGAGDQGRAPALRVLPGPGAPPAVRSRQAQRVTRWALEHLWAPVGTGVRPQAETDFAAVTVFGDEAGMAADDGDGRDARDGSPASTASTSTGTRSADAMRRGGDGRTRPARERLATPFARCARSAPRSGSRRGRSGPVVPWPEPSPDTPGALPWTSHEIIMAPGPRRFPPRSSWPRAVRSCTTGGPDTARSCGRSPSP
jgi:hypothetical protein